MILAFDSSSAMGSVALLDGDEVVQEIPVPAPRGRGGALFAALEKVLAEGPELDRVVVGIGPGSYNGIRATLASGWGIARARKIPLVGLCSLLGLGDGSYCAVGDARRGQYYFASVEDGVLVDAPCLLTPEQALARVAGRRVIVPAAVDFLPDAEVRGTAAGRLGRIGRVSRPQDSVPEPLYLKEPFITTPTGKGI